MTLIERFEAKVERVPEAGCWLWTGALDDDGYGSIHTPWSRYDIRAHRASYRLFKGEIPAGMLVCHRCDVPSCVNPAHLFLGSQRENLADQRRKGRRQGGPPVKSHCKYGHALSGDNILWVSAGPKYLKPVRRICRTCNNRRRQL